jgi:hypothetical protein
MSRRHLELYAACYWNSAPGAFTRLEADLMPTGGIRDQTPARNLLRDR